MTRDRRARDDRLGVGVTEAIAVFIGVPVRIARALVDEPLDQDCDGTIDEGISC